MDLLTNVGVVVTGLVTVVSGLFALASLFFDELI